MSKKERKRNIFYRIYKLIDGFIDKQTADHVGAFSAQSAYFIILSFFPFIMLLLTLLKYTPVTEEFLIERITSVIPSSFNDIAIEAISDLYERSGIGLISITAITALWSASNGIMSLIEGFDTIYSTEKKRNYFVSKALSALYTIIFIIGIVLSLVLMVYGNILLKFVNVHFPFIYNIVDNIIKLRGLYIPFILTFIFVLLYKMVPIKSFRITDHLPGALFSALVWEIFSYGYSIYVDYYSAHSYIYGSLTVIVLLILWVYICMYILFLGAEINVYFHEHLKNAKSIIKTLKESESTNSQTKK